VAIVAAKAPEHLEAFKAMVLGVAKAMAEEVDGTSEKESAAIERIRGALDGPAPA
jgi:mannose/fructose/N-acetylgalactosamine-specific phosphotransferase system component IID